MLAVSAYDSHYDVNKSKRYVEFAGIAYCSDPLIGKNTVDNWSCKICKNYPNVTATSFYGSKATDAKGYIAYDPKANEILVVYSGTDPASIRNWIDDIDTIKTAYPYCSSTGCKVHEGFYRTYTSTDASMKSILSKYVSQHKSASITVTGHSLGAALVAHAVAELTMIGYKLTPAYAYGMPRVGDESFEKWYTSKTTGTFRIVHHKDPVPHLPAKDWGFHHMPYEVFYTQDNYSDSKVCNAEGEDATCSDQYKVDINVLDHLHYMGFDFTTNYLSLGCAL